jgi:signal transduction protein with GAF and PtsI domain
LIRTDAVLVLVTIGPTRLKVVTVSGALRGFLGRQIRVGEGLAGRVMQTLYPMRVDNYHFWNGRSLDLEDLPVYASMSVPLIYNGRLVGVLNAHETAPGRVFTDCDQTILELLAPHAASAIATARLDSELMRTHTYFQAVMNHSVHAVMVFDPTGILWEANVAAWRYLEILFGGTMLPLSAIQLAARAEDNAFTEALVTWAADPAATQTIDISYVGLGRFQVDLLPIAHTAGAAPDLLVEMRAFPAL